MDAKSSQMPTAPVRKKRKCQAMDNAAAGPSTSSAEHQRVPVLRGRRKIGLLASLPSMPLDILFEILGHLKPYDVLKLSRTTKDFRRLLLSKSSLSIWKAALSNVPGLPDCPPDMSEPAWTNLVFSPQCNYCLTTSIRKVQWMFRVRICSKCAKEHLAESRFVFHSFEANVGLLIPTSLGSAITPIFYPKCSNDLIITEKGVKIYLKSDRELVETQYAALEKGEARRLFVEERKKAVLAIAQHAKLCEIWARSQTLDRDQQLQQLREDRLAAITQKLENLGWAEDIAGISVPDCLANHKLVDRPQLLTERIWTNIKPGILEFMAEMREKRFKREFAALVNRRKRSALNVLRTFKNERLPETEIMPQGPDFCHFPVISDALNQAAEVEVDVSSFNDIIPLLPELIKEWRESIKRKMVQVVKMRNYTRRSRGLSYLDFVLDGYSDEDDEGPPVGPSSNLTEEQLSQKLTLASTVFTCDCGGSYNDFPSIYDSDDEEDYWSTSKVLFYPQVMGHSCLARISKMFPWELSATGDPSCRLESCRSERKQWDSSSLSLEFGASKTAQYIIQIAGLDPDLATSDEMDQLEIRFGCKSCMKMVSPEDQKDDDDDDEEDGNLYDYNLAMPIFNWRGAISHHTNRHPMRSIDKTSVTISEDDFTADVKEAESEHWAEVDYIWSCTHCRDLPTETKVDTFEGVKKHISRVHRVESPKLNEDYFQHFAAADLRNHDLSMTPFYVRYSKGGLIHYKEDSGLILAPHGSSFFYP